MATSEFHAAWKEANEKVREAEKRLGEAWTAFAAGTGAPPSAELLTAVSKLRRECDQRLAAVLDQFRRSTTQ